MRSKQKQLRKSYNKQQNQITQSLLNRKIVSPQKLKILVLAGNELFNEQLEFLQKCINLIKLDISHNHITKLSQKIEFGNLTRLQVLHLHYNKFTSIEAIFAIFECPTLTHLTYHHNPIENNAKYQHEIINNIPTLKLINNRIVYIEERSDCFLPERNLTFVNSDFFQNWKSTENSEAYYLKVLNLQLQFIDNVWAFNNPIVIIQRAWKHFLPDQIIQKSSIGSAQRSLKSKITDRRGMTNKTKREWIENHPLRSFFQEWKSFSQNIKEVRLSLTKIKQNKKIVDKSYLLLPLKQYFRWTRNLRTRDPLMKYLQKIRTKIYQKKMAYLFAANIEMKRVLFQGEFSFYEICIKNSNRLYYNRNQQHILDNFLLTIAQRFNKRQIIYNKSIFRANRTFNAIRLVDPDTFTNKYSSGNPYFSFCSLMWPSMKLVIVNRKKAPTIFKSGIIGIKQLSYIKNRDKIVTKTQMKKSIEIYKRLQKFSLNEYQTSLWYFQCTDQLVMKQLLRMIFYHNTNSIKFQIKHKKSQMLSLLQKFDQPFIPYVENVMKRTAAAVIIQKTWRRFMSNKNQKQSIYFKIKKNRAALHIQHFLRDCLYKHRLYFSKKLYNDLALIKSSTLIFPLQFYLNINQIYNSKVRGRLFKSFKLTRRGNLFGASQQFFRPIIHSSIRDKYFEGRTLGVQNYEQQIDIFNLLHFNAQIKMMQKNEQSFISFTYFSKIQASMISSIIALLSYQMWGKYYIFPLTRQNFDIWDSRIEEYRNVRLIKQFIKEYKKQGQQNFNIKQIREEGVFLYKAQKKFIKIIPKFQITVQFYQKKYHNFPVKFLQKLAYSFVNCQNIFAFQTSNKIKADIDKLEMPIQQLQIVKQLSSSRSKITSNNKILLKDLSSNLESQNFLNVTYIDKKRFSLFDHSLRNINSKEKLTNKSQLQEFSKTAIVIEQSKRDKVKQFYKDQFIKKETQKEMKEISLTAIREKARLQRTMNSTIRNMKEIERSEALRNKVNKVKEFKNRVSLQNRDEEEFIQQNNFVMEQQLKMVIMRSKMKELDNRKQQNYGSHKLSNTNQIFSQNQTIQSRKSSKQKAKMQQQEILQSTVLNNPTQGQQGSIINVRKKSRKPRANSIGAYIRDPSFVHGVFPQEYYPIENRATSFYFPPVI